MENMDVTADSKGRINLGSKHAGQRYIITKDEQGTVVLEKAALIPEREIWLHRNQEAKHSVSKGLEEAKRGETRIDVFDLDAFDEDDDQ